MRTTISHPLTLMLIGCLLLCAGTIAAVAPAQDATVTASRFELVDAAGRPVISVHSDDDQPNVIRLRDGDGALLATIDAADVHSLFEWPQAVREQHQQLDNQVEQVHGRVRLAMQRVDAHDRQLREIEQDRRPPAEMREREDRIRRLVQQLDSMQRDRQRLLRQVDEADRTIRSLDRRVRRLERGR